jgi:hypothetical protein
MDEDRVCTNQDALPCGRDIVIIDHEDDDDDLYGVPDQPTIKPCFTDFTQLANMWCDDYVKGPLNNVATMPLKPKDNRHKYFAYPTPEPSDECFDPVVYPKP